MRNEVIKTYKSIFAQEKRKPNVKTGANRHFPYFVATNSITSEYDLAEKVLEDSKDENYFPIDEFMMYSSLAIIKNDSDFASKALQVAEVKKSKFRYHRNIGLVGKEHDKTIKLLLKIV